MLDFDTCGGFNNFTNCQGSVCALRVIEPRSQRERIARAVEGEVDERSPRPVVGHRHLAIRIRTSVDKPHPQHVAHH